MRLKEELLLLFFWGWHLVKCDTLVTKYSYLWDGTKLSVTNSENCSFLYRGSFTYKEVIENGTSCQVENVPFSSGYIVATEENTEVRYFLTDHLGSVRVVATDKDNVLERNDYYPFGLRHPASLMPISDNRVRFNGKEDQIFIGEYLSDYGVRCYNKLNGRWLMPDPLAEKYFNITQYSFCINNPINYIDLWGLDIWTTNDPDLIRLIIDGIRSTGRIDTSGMNHYTDEEFLNADIDADIYMNQTDNGDYYIVWKTSDNSGVQVNTFKIPFLCSADFWDFDDLNSYMQSSKDTGKDKNLHPIISGIGFTAAVGEQVMYSDFGTWMGRDWKIRSQRWGGNRFTGGKLRYAKRVSKYFKWLGYGATLISMADTEMIYRRELITNKQRWISHGSDIMSSLPYGLGLGWTIGWESGQLVQQYTK